MITPTLTLRIVTDYPVAVDSFDHTHPKGTMQDNTHAPQFVHAVERVFDGRKVAVMDLGCAGGGLVKDFLDAGHFAVGIEGSDYSREHHRAEWATIPANLFTADITKPFKIYALESEDTFNLLRHSLFDYRTLFDVITAWEVLEHIAVSDLPGLIRNIWRNLAARGLFVASVAAFEDEGYHVTLASKEWWLAQFERAGFENAEGMFTTGEYARQSSLYLVVRKVGA